MMSSGSAGPYIHAHHRRHPHTLKPIHDGSSTNTTSHPQTHPRRQLHGNLVTTIHSVTIAATCRPTKLTRTTTRSTRPDPGPTPTRHLPRMPTNIAAPSKPTKLERFIRCVCLACRVRPLDTSCMLHIVHLVLKRFIRWSCVYCGMGCIRVHCSSSTAHTSLADSCRLLGNRAMPLASGCWSQS
jgi:hypothetical protein